MNTETSGTDATGASEAAASIWNAWARGRCPCCGAELEKSSNGVPCEVLAEMVSICGRCSENEHGRDDGADGNRFVPALLEAIVTRTDAPIDRLLDELSREVNNAGGDHC